MSNHEYEHEPVPVQARRGLLSVAAVWAGFPMCLGNAVFGGLIVYSLGMSRGLVAILLGNLLLFAYVGTLSWIGGRTGRNFSLQAGRAFGDRGRAAVVAFLATVVIGWFSYQVGLTGTTLEGMYGWNPLWGGLIGGVFFVLLTLAGIRALSLIGLIGTPLFLIMAGLALYYGLGHGHSLSDAFDYTGGGGPLGFWACVSIVVGGFADSGTMTADFTRWARDGRAGVLAAASAFPFANSVAFLIGGLVVAIGGASDPANNGGAFLGLLAGHGAIITALSVVFVFANLGSVAAHCLYNGAVGWAGITPLRMRPLAIALGALGTVVALTGVWAHITNWLVLLGVVVPPIGAVLIVDYVLARSRGAVPAPVRPVAFAAWGIGAVAAGLAHYHLPGSVDAVIGFVTAAAVQAGLTALLPAAAPRSAVAAATVSG
ncbi:purine-cytosine permease family protein [Nocardia concava]|uniref:purine-cytosine permease family protein n=1 Tax=Nocardia concava TaxID=257281 RepID=UPI0003105810|nr:cytosine permease [Nocardia concava]